MAARILIVDYGSQTTEVIARALREEGYRSGILDPVKAALWLREGNPTDAIILSGGDKSVYDADALKLPKEVLLARRADGLLVPVLGICYGHQLLAYALGGAVEKMGAEHGCARIETAATSRMFGGLPMTQEVWSNHSDSVVALPPSFRETARSLGTGCVAAMESGNGRFFGVQFHPESPETPYGKEMLLAFVRDRCGCRKDWEPAPLITSIGEEIRANIMNDLVVIPYSGGVDSSVVAAIGVRNLGTRASGITLDAGNLREGELDEIRASAQHIGLYHNVANAHADVALFANTIDAEEKRRIFQSIYVSHIKVEIANRGARFLFDGTLAPDEIESGARGGDRIKTHHNVGVDYGVKVFKPLRDFFKHEVRALARELGLSTNISERKPFPGPGNIIRVVGVPVTQERLAVVRLAYAQVEEVLKQDAKFYGNISQLVVAYLGLNTTGIKGDKRAYDHAIAVRAVHTTDFMTAEGLWLPEAAVREIKSRVKHPFINRVFFDPTDKGPATVEYE